MRRDTSVLIKAIVVLALLSIASAFVSVALSAFLAGVTAVIAFIYLTYHWDEIVVWWHTKK